MAGNLHLRLVDLFSADRAAAAESIREACLDCGFFYIKNHGIDTELELVFRESEKFFSLPLDEKLKLQRNDDYRGYTPPYAENLDPSSKSKGDLKESFYIGPAKSYKSLLESNQWPSEESLPLWRATMVSYYEKILIIGKHLLSLIALSLKLDERFFETIGALDPPMGFVRLLHYPGELKVEDYDNYGASAHSDYGMVTLLATDGVPGLQICKEKDRRPQLWEDVPHIDGALIVNIGDMLERWTNCLFRSTLHRVVAIGKERYSVAFFLDPNSDCLVECLESCCSQTFPPSRPLPIRERTPASLQTKFVQLQQIGLLCGDGVLGKKSCDVRLETGSWLTFKFSQANFSLRVTCCFAEIMGNILFFRHCGLEQEIIGCRNLRIERRI